MVFDLLVSDTYATMTSNGEDDIQHFLLKCDKANKYLKYWFKWWTNISELDISNFGYLEECVLFGFPGEN